MSIFRVCLSHQLRCLLHRSSPRTSLVEIVSIQKAPVFSRNKETQALRFEKKLQKLLAKKRKFDAVSPTQLGKMAKLVNPRLTAAQTRHGKEMAADGSIKLRTYNTLLHQSIDDIITQDLEDLQISILGVRLTGDLSTCRVYWQASGDYQVDQKIQGALDSYAGKLRHYDNGIDILMKTLLYFPRGQESNRHTLINLRVLGRIPQIAFLQEKSSAKRAEVDRLLEIADIPPDDSEGQSEPISEEAVESTSEKLEPVLGLDQAEINLQITKMKKHHQHSLAESSGEDSIDKFRSSIKRRKKGRAKALYSHGTERNLENSLDKDDQLDEHYFSDDDEHR